MSFWNTVALPILGFMRRANYPEDAMQLDTSFLRTEIVPLLGPCKTPAYPSWITDDHTPVEFSHILGETNKSPVRFAFEPAVLPLAGDRSIATLRRTLERLASKLTMEPRFDLEWFDICAEELLLAETQEAPKDGSHPVSEVCIGLDLAHYSATTKVYFMPRIRALVTKETPVEMMERVTCRIGVERPWAKIGQFLSRFLPGDRPEIEIVAVDCVPGAQNRLKVYFRTNILSCAHMEYFLTLGGVLSDAGVSAGLRNAQLMWNALMQAPREARNGLSTQAPYFPLGLVYYELKQGDDTPSAKVYLPVQRYLSNDLEISRAVEHLVSSFSGSPITDDYSDFIKATFPHRDLSARTGIHTYLSCTVKPGGSDLAIYYNPEAFAPERSVNTP